MLALVEVAVVALVALFAASIFVRRRRSGERDAVMERRVEAYMQTIRREGSNPELAAMSDLELRDLLLSGARNLRIEAERRSYILAAASLVGVIAAIIVGTQDGWRGFAITLVLAAIVIYGIGEYLARRMREPLVSRGLDIERLRVE